MAEFSLSHDDYFLLSRQLEQHHPLFYMMWELGRPIFDHSISTAQVDFDKLGEVIRFRFSPSLWSKLDDYERVFVIAHECLHIVLKHGLRVSGSNRINAEVSNVAMDLVVNHTLVRSFGFDRDRIKNKNLCWVDTVFPNRTDIPSDESFEFYFNKFQKIGVVADTVDDHSTLGADSKAFDGVLGNLNEKLSAQEKESLRGTVEKHSAGEASGWVFATPGHVKKKRKWETVIKKWSRRYTRSDLHDVDQWARINRRFTLLPNDLMLPTEMEIEHEIEGKIQVAFYLDTSGSCKSFADRFFKAAMSLDPKRFQVDLICFDTKCYPTTLESRKLYGFGGTSFSCIEAHIQRKMRETGAKYPEAVWILSDGYGTYVNVKPELQSKWYWFLTALAPANTRFVPKGSHMYNLKEFE